MIAVMSAMREELGTLLDEVEETDPGTTVLGGREFHHGILFGQEVVLAFSRWGKVASASVATTLLQHFGVEEVIFTGVAGALDPELQVGDVVVASELIQHDMDASAIPGIERFEIPLLGMTRFPTNPARREAGMRGIRAFLEMGGGEGVEHSPFAQLGERHPKVFQGLVASGDQFIANRETREEIVRWLPDALCVEMEGRPSPRSVTSMAGPVPWFGPFPIPPTSSLLWTFPSSWNPWRDSIPRVSSEPF